MRMHQIEEVAPEKNRQRTVFRRSRLRRSRRIVEQSQFTEKIAALKRGDRFVRLTLTADQDLARADEINGLPFLALVEDHFVFQVVALVHETVDDFHLAPVQVDEQR